MNEYKGHFCLSRHLLPAIALYPTQKNWKCLHIRNRQYTKFHISNFWSRRSLGRKPRFFSPLGSDVETNSDNKTQKIKLYSVRTLKRYLKGKNLILGRVMATISKFSPQIFEMYFSTSLILLSISVLQAEICKLYSAVCLKFLHVFYTQFLRESCFSTGVFETSSRWVRGDDLKTKGDISSFQ